MRVAVGVAAVVEAVGVVVGEEPLEHRDPCRARLVCRVGAQVVAVVVGVAVVVVVVVCGPVVVPVEAAHVVMPPRGRGT